MSTPTARLVWYRRIFQPTWEEEKFVKTVGYSLRRHGFWETENFTGSLYSQLNLKTGNRRYWVRGMGSDSSIDSGAWEASQTIVYL